MTAERVCGECSACCRLLPVVELHKAAGERCPHRRHRKGCAIYPRRPVSCKAWSCLWLSDPNTKDLRRPDHSGYALDCMEDFVTIRDEITGATISFKVIQIWASEGGVTLESGLVPYLEARRAGGLIRSAGPEVVSLIPPWASPTKTWAVHESKVNVPQHTLVEIKKMLAPERTLP